MLYAFKLGRKLRGEEPYCPEKGGKGGSSDKSAKYAAEAQKYAADLQNQQWQTIMKNLAPFTPLAEQYVNQLQNLSSLEGQGQALNQYYNSQQYKDLAGQARYQSLAAAEATGGLGSTATSNQLATIAPTLGQSWLTQHNVFRAECRIRVWRQQGTWVPVVLTPLQKRRCIFRGCRRLTIQVRRLCSSRFVKFRNTPTITTNNITLMLVNLSGSNLNLHRYHSQQPAVTFLHYGVING